MITLPYNNKSPKVSRDCFLAENVALVGDVFVGEASSLWFGVVVRAEGGPVRIGRGVNVQDNSVIHVDPDGKCFISDCVSIGHSAVVHGATVGENSLVGMGSILLNDCVIGRNCLIGAGTLVTEGTEIPDDSLVLGAPARVKRKLTTEEIERVGENARKYDELRVGYLSLAGKRF